MLENRIEVKNTRLKLGIVIPIWNNWGDTKVCLDSLIKIQNQSIFIIVVDNGSSPESLGAVHDYLTAWRTSPMQYGKSIYLIENGENLGFAKAVNIGLRACLARGAEYLMLLNNDTFVPNSSLEQLIEFLDQNPEVQGVVPRINYYDNPDIVWNCGGRLSYLGYRKYYYSNQVWQGQKILPFRISFATGCALMLRAKIIHDIGFFTECFFFGEEDFDFCWRMKRGRRKLFCFPAAMIYHKVSRSSRAAAKVGERGRAYVYYLNRWINMKMKMPYPLWVAWRILYTPYIAYLLYRRHRISAEGTLKFLRYLWRESQTLDGVSREKFFSSMIGAP